MRIPYGLDRLPRSIALDDPRLRCAEVGDEPLRLNSEPVPADAMPLAIGDHAARVAAAKEWLEGLCGDYAPLRRQFIARVFPLHRGADRRASGGTGRAREAVRWAFCAGGFSVVGAAPVAARMGAGRLDALLPADMVFWDGAQAIADRTAARETEKQKALLAAAGVIGGSHQTGGARRR